MAKPGPARKRTAELLGHRKGTDRLKVDRVAADYSGPAKVDRKWHPIARRWYRAMCRAAVGEFFDATDWALVAYVADQMSRSLQVPKDMWTSSHLKNVMAAAESLLSTEAARRSAHIEFEQRALGAGAKPKERRDYRTRLTVVPAPDSDGTDRGATGTG